MFKIPITVGDELAEISNAIDTLVYTTEGSSVGSHVIHRDTCVGAQLWRFNMVTPLEN
jgi:hypothetical protein